MTIASEITRIQNNIADTYTALSAKGATMPATQNSANLAATVESVSTGASEIVTATNNSSYGRIVSEKVWLNKSGNSYSIINYASADINSLIGTCKEYIAIGASGDVETLTNGVLVPHRIRNFVLGGNTTEANVDDVNQVLTYDFDGTGSETGCFIVSNLLNYTPESFDNARVRLTFKIVSLDENQNTDLSTLAIYLGYMTSEDTTSWNPPDEYIRGDYQMLSDKFQAQFYDNTPQSRTLQVNKNAGTLFILDNWMRLTMNYVNSYDGSNLYIGNLTTSASGTANRGYGMYRSQGNIQRFFIGLNSVPVGAKFRIIFDLSQCNITDSNNVIRWQPYGGEA